ncbi:MAG: PIN domain-containing protein [Candidatus Woykebacteria bacterium]
MAVTSGLVSVFSSHKIIFIDTNVFIYALEDNPNFPAAKEIFRLIKEKHKETYTSVISLLEASVKLFDLGQKEKIEEYLNFISGHGLIQILDINKSVSIKAAEIRSKYRFKTPDSIQLAAAILARATLFITADRDFVKKAENLEILVI